MRAETADQARTAVAEAWAANARSDWSDALSRWGALQARYPANPVGYLGAGLALRGAGRLDEADRVLGEAVERFAGHAEIAIAHAWLANARRDWPEAIGRWQAVCERFPDNPRAHLGAASAFTATGQADRAATCLEAAQSALAAARGTLDPRTVLTIEFELAKARLDWPAVRDSAARLVGIEPAPHAPVLLALAQSCWHLGDLDGADAAAERALSIDPALSDAVLVRIWVATDRGEAGAALALHRRLAQLNPNTVRWTLKLIQLLNWLGHIDEATAELDAARRRWPNDPIVRVFARNFGPATALPPPTAEFADAGDEELRRLEAVAPRADQLQRDVLADDPLRDVILAAAPGARTAVLVFTGGNDAVSIPLRLFDRYLAALGLTAVYIKDFNRLRFLGGVRSLGDYEATLGALRAELARLGIERVCALGNCDGGFAAIRYGVDLGAERIVAFAASTHSSGDAPTRLEQSRNFMRRRLATSVSETMTDLRPFLEARSEPRRVALFFDRENARDRSHAERLSGLAGVTLHAEPGPCQHGVLCQFALTSDFLGLLADQLGVERH